MSRNAAHAWRFGVSRASGVLARLDVARSTGLRYAVRRYRESGSWDTLRPLPRDVIYGDIWRDAAHELEAEITEITPWTLDIRRGDAIVRVDYAVVPLDAAEVPRSPVTRAGDKPFVHRLLSDLGLPVPASLEFSPTRPGAALEFMRADAGRPVFVKPHAGAGGWGVTGSILRTPQLLRASLSTARYSNRALVEREVAGDVYRLLYLDGELLDTVRRRRPTLVGDGHSTVLELVHAENHRRIAAYGRAGLWLLRIDLDALFALERAGLGLGSVVAEGVPVEVKGTTAENCLVDNETVREVGPELVTQVSEAVRALGLRLAGVDLVTTDVTKPLARDRGAIIEINENPGLSYHYLVADPTRKTHVAVPILARCLDEADARQPSSHA